MASVGTEIAWNIITNELKNASIVPGEDIAYYAIPFKLSDYPEINLGFKEAFGVLISDSEMISTEVYSAPTFDLAVDTANEASYHRVEAMER